MRLAHVINGLDDGGAEAVLFRLCRADDANEHLVISLQDGGKYGPLLEDIGVRVESIGMRRGRMTPRGLYVLAQHLRAMRPDIVQTWMYHSNLVGGLAARVVGVRSVVWGVHHTSLSATETAFTTRAAARLGGPASRLLVDRIAYCAQRSREVHEDLVYAADKGTVIPNGYDVDEYRPDAPRGAAWRRSVRVPDGVPLLGMVGRFDPQKDHRNLIEAVAIVARTVPRFMVALVGNGLEASNDTLRHWIADKRLDDRFLLVGRSNDVPAVMNGLDLHVLSSRFGEAFPNVVCESMACGTPNVVTDVGDAGAIVDETGWVVSPADPEAFAHAITLALREFGASPERWKRRCAAARDRIVRNYSLERMVEAYRKVWISASSKRRQ